MVLRLRGFAKTVSAVLVLLSLWSLPHRSLPDVCVPAGFEEHDESKHIYTTATQDAHEEHCALCHWMRSLKPAFAARPYTSTGAEAGAAVVAHASHARRSAALCNIPPRAPPAA